jgi:hypothetical protein
VQENVLWHIVSGEINSLFMRPGKMEILLEAKAVELM